MCLKLSIYKIKIHKMANSIKNMPMICNYTSHTYFNLTDRKGNKNEDFIEFKNGQADLIK